MDFTRNQKYNRNITFTLRLRSGQSIGSFTFYISLTGFARSYSGHEQPCCCPRLVKP